jgi:cation diffusion facilitator CzcD-associated flavoprotein CzcO
MPSSTTIPVAVIGAGPYGLSMAAHLSALGVPFRIFGEPMGAWRHGMPQGMFLKSEGHASSLSDPAARDTLGAYCKRRNLPYRNFGLPVPLDLFIDYGLDFQRRHVPQVEEASVIALCRSPPGFELVLDNGDAVRAANVVVAVGFAPFRRVPDIFAGIGPDHVSHSGDHHDYSRFSGKAVCVVGAGASATDVAAALYAAKARPHIVTRAAQLRWVSQRTDLPRFERFATLDVLGGGRYGQGYALSQLPNLYRYLPASVRMRIAGGYLGPRGGWPVRECVEALPIALAVDIISASERNGEVALVLRHSDGVVDLLHADHVIAATGYKIDLKRIEALSTELLGAINTLGGAPELSRRFESSVPGLYFIGYTALHSFGPLMRFVAGSRFAASSVAQAIAESLHKDRARAVASPSAPRASGTISATERK